MKKIKFAFMILAMLAMSIGFAGCGSDDEEIDTPKQQQSQSRTITITNRSGSDLKFVEIVVYNTSSENEDEENTFYYEKIPNGASITVAMKNGANRWYIVCYKGTVQYESDEYSSSLIITPSVMEEWYH